MTLGLALVVLGALAAGGAAIGASAQGKTIRLGYQSGPVLSWVVKEKQLLKKRGYKPEWTLFQYAAPELEAMAAGSIDMGSMGTLPIVMISLNNSDIWYVYDELVQALDGPAGNHAPGPGPDSRGAVGDAPGSLTTAQSSIARGVAAMGDVFSAWLGGSCCIQAR